MAGAFVVLAVLLGVKYSEELNGMLADNERAAESDRTAMTANDADETASPEGRVAGASVTVEPFFPEPDPACAYDTDDPDAAPAEGCVE